MGLVQHRTMK